MTANTEIHSLLRSTLEESRDLLLETRQGHPARSAGHNARLAVERALALLDTASPIVGEDALLPCPFCGPGQSQVDLWFDDVAERWRVGCGRCGCSTGTSPRDDGKQPATDRWNKRAIPTPTAGREHNPVEMGDGRYGCSRCGVLSIDFDKPCEAASDGRMYASVSTAGRAEGLEGWKLAPVIPTPEMIESGLEISSLVLHRSTATYLRDVWEAMWQTIKTAPTPQAVTVDDARDPVVPEHALHNAVLTFGIANGLDDAGEAETYRDALRDVLREFMRDNMNAPSPIADEARGPREQLLTIVDLQERFEAWMASSNYPEIADVALEKLPDGQYKGQLTFAAYETWKFCHQLLSRIPSEEATDWYLVWSHEHGAWWRADSCGYTVHLKAAGVYTRDKALAICAGSRNGWQSECAPYEIPVRQCDARACESRVKAITRAPGAGT